MRLLPILVLAAAPALAAAASIEGEITLHCSKDAFAKDSFQKEFGDLVKAKTHWRAGDFLGRETVFAGISVKNTSTKPMFFQYCVSFFDKNGNLIGATGQGLFGDKGLEAGKETQMGSCLIHLPKDKYKEIKSYKAVLYESETQLGR
jgi:hypothetical protein